MAKTKFKASHHYITFLFALMPAVAIFVLCIMPAEVGMQWWILFGAMTVIFTLFLGYRLLVDGRTLETNGSVLIVSKLYGLLKEGEVDLRRFDGYVVEIERHGKGGKDTYGYFCLMKSGIVYSRLCFNAYKDFQDFLKEGVDPYLKRITYMRKEGGRYEY